MFCPIDWVDHPNMDINTANQLVKRVDNARVEKMLTDRRPPPPSADQ